MTDRIITLQTIREDMMSRLGLVAAPASFAITANRSDLRLALAKLVNIGDDASVIAVEADTLNELIQQATYRSYHAVREVYTSIAESSCTLVSDSTTCPIDREAVLLHAQSQYRRNEGQTNDADRLMSEWEQRISDLLRGYINYRETAELNAHIQAGARRVLQKLPNYPQTKSTTEVRLNAGVRSFNLPGTAGPGQVTRVGYYDGTGRVIEMEREDFALRFQVGATPTGSITFAGQPDDADTVVIPDDTTSYTFEFDSDSSVVETTTLRRVVIGATLEVTIANLIAAIQASAIQVTPGRGEGDVVTLDHKLDGAAGVVAITTPVNVSGNLSVSGFTDTQDQWRGKPKYWQTTGTQVVVYPIPDVAMRLVVEHGSVPTFASNSDSSTIDGESVLLAALVSWHMRRQQIDQARIRDVEFDQRIGHLMGQHTNARRKLPGGSPVYTSIPASWRNF